jgi:thiamine pyrophosphate-dependent acetolactate synthase large subunit-like protein
MKARGERLAERVSRGLRNEGIHAAYGLPGGADNLDVIDACRRRRRSRR